MIQQYYQNRHKHLIAVDCIIFGFDSSGLELLLIKRGIEPKSGMWSLMGGFLEDNESLDESAQRVLEELTGLTDIYLEQVHTFGGVTRDQGARVVSVSYFALMRTDDYNKELAKTFGAKWFQLNEMPDLIFDHDIMIEKALNRLQRKTKTQPIGFELLPEKFTIPQLQKLYEAINQQTIDKRNFRKKILATCLLKKLDEKDKNNSKKGAYLYKFDKEKYHNLVNKGYNFEIF